MDHDDILDFPCEFPIKIMGLADNDIESLVRSIARAHVADEAILDINSRASKAGKYISVTLTIRAENREQLDRLYSDFNAHEHVVMTL